jgi:benzoylformate decarboxylase
MVTIREEAFRLLRSLGLTTIFGNPGSTELPFLQHVPADFTYVLGLQEASVVAMADGFAQASGHAVLVNLHTAPGVGNAMGNIITAFENKTPLIITAGQQVREMIGLEPLLYARDAVELPKPYVKWSYEPTRAQDIPMALARAYYIAMQHPRGPVFLSLHMDDWEQEAEPFEVREVSQRTAPDPVLLQQVAELLQTKQKLALVVGAEADRADAWDVLVALAERLSADVWTAPLASRRGFPEDHPHFRGDLPPALKALAEKLTGYDAVLVVGAPVFRYYPYIPGPVLKDGIMLVQLTNDPDEAARAPIGTSVVGDIALAAEQLLSLLPVTASRHAQPEPRRRPDVPPALAPITPAFVMHTLASILPAHAVIVDEAPSMQSALHRFIPMTEPGSWYLTGSGGLGFGMPAAIGVQMAQPERRVICTIGDGSSMYSIQSLWTAAHYHIPVVFVVLRNSTYAILKAFAQLEKIAGELPGLELPDIDIVQIARGFGCEAWRVEQPDELAASLQRALKLTEPVVVEVIVDPKHISLL